MRPWKCMFCGEWYPDNVTKCPRCSGIDFQDEPDWIEVAQKHVRDKLRMNTDIIIERGNKKKRDRERRKARNANVDG